MLLDDYESARPPRRSHTELVLSRKDREDILIEWGATFHEVSKRRVKAIRHQLEQTKRALYILHVSSAPCSYLIDIYLTFGTDY
jgi:hypothetical protein